MEPTTQRHRPRLGAALAFAQCPRAGRIAGLWMLFAVLSAPAAPAATPRVTLEATLAAGVKGAVAALAINADETIIAAAGGGDGGQVTVALLDRPSGAPLGRVAATVGQNPRLAFSPVSDLLLVAGNKGVQLWDVSPQGLQPGQPAGPGRLRWQVQIDQSAPAGAVGFALAPHRALWSAGPTLFQREVAAGSAFDPKAGQQPDAETPPVAGFAVGPNGLAMHRRGAKTIELLDPSTLARRQELAGHRFPVVAARFDRRGALVSVDSKGNVFRWNPPGGSELVAGLAAKAGTPPDPAAVRLFPLHPPHFLIAGGGGVGGGAAGSILNLRLRSTTPGPELAQPDSTPLAVSPTGRYILAGDGGQVKVFGFSLPMPPAEYVESLKGLKALEVAKNYANLLDTKGLSEKSRADLARALRRDRRGDSLLVLKDFLVSLEASGREENLEGMVYWAQKVLQKEPNHPAAAQALARVAEIRDGRLIDQARGALAQGRHRQAIALLSRRIAPVSTRYQDALELIDEAERARSVLTVLEQAREQMNLGNFAAAQTLAGEAFRQDPQNPTVMALRSEIAGRAGGLAPQTMVLVAALLLGVSAVGGGLFRYRHALMPALRAFSIRESEPARGGGRPSRAGRPAPGTGARPPPGGAPHASPREFARRAPVPPRLAGAEREQRRRVERLLEKTEDLIRFSRQADRDQNHTAFLMELEAEVNALHRRTVDRSADLGRVEARLGEMAAQLGRLKFSAASKADSLVPGNTLYDVLKLPPDADSAEIKAAYHKLVKEYHPDLHSGSNFGWIKAEAETMSKKISEAYQVLSEPRERQKYDLKLASRRGPK
ncbi:MAG: J domain-containing protein [bacterium]